MKIMSLMSATALLLGAPVASFSLPVAAHAQQNGESRCGADGWVERYSEMMHSWMSSVTKCAGNGSSYSSGRQSENNSNEPQDGDTKCGADGKVYHYYAYSHSWSGGILDCR